MIHSLITGLIRGNRPPFIFQLVSACSFLPFFLCLLFLTLELVSDRERGTRALLSPQSFWLRGSWLCRLGRVALECDETRGLSPALDFLHAWADTCFLPGYLPLTLGAWMWDSSRHIPGVPPLDEWALITAFCLHPGLWSQGLFSHAHCWRLWDAQLWASLKNTSRN